MTPRRTPTVHERTFSVITYLRGHRRALAAAAATLAVAAGATVSALAATPPWQQSGNVNHDPNRVGTLAFYNAAGKQIFGGSLNESPIAAYVVGSKAIEAGDTKATLYAYLPQSGTPAAGWTGSALTAATDFPNSGAPGALGSSTLPLETGAAGDTSLADFIATHPNTSTAAAYKNVYELRLRTSAPGRPIAAKYDAADVVVTGSTWQVVYPSGATVTKTKTTTTLAVSTKPRAGVKTTLTATVKPAAAGSVNFTDGTKKLGSVKVARGKAVLKVKLKAGKQTVTATFTPTSSTVLGSKASKKITVAKAK